MRRTAAFMAASLGLLFGLLVAMPAAAATTGTICGEVTAFTAPTAGSDGSLTIDGTTEAIDSSASAALDAATLTTLDALAAADATTCLEIEANAGGDIVDAQVATQAQICGTVTVDTTSGAFSVDGVALPTGAVSGDAEVSAVLDAAADAGADACAEVGLDVSSGQIASVGVEASFELCGEVTSSASGDATVDGADVDAALLDGDAAALLALAASADGTACVSIDAASTNGQTSVGVTVDVEVCAEVTAIGDGTIALNGVTLVFGGAADTDIEVGDVVCVAAGTGPTGDGVITDLDLTLGGGEAAGGGDLLPDTAAPGTRQGDLAASGVVLLIASAIGLSALRRSHLRC
jgi:hypothetical protein